MLEQGSGSGKPDRLSFNGALSWLPLLLAAVCLVRSWSYGQAFLGVDFYQFWAVGQKTARESAANIYSDDARRRLGEEFLRKAAANGSSRLRRAAGNRRVLETYSTPFLYSLFAGFPAEDYDLAYGIYRLLCMACMVYAVATLAGLFRFSAAASALLFAALTAYFAPYLSDVAVANVNQVQLGLLALFLWVESRRDLGSRHLLGGAVLGSAVMFKPNLVFVVLLLGLSWLIGGRFKDALSAAVGAAAAAAAAVVFSSAMFGSARCWLDWIKALLLMPAEIVPVAFGNYSLPRLVMDLSGMDLAGPLAVLLVSLSALAMWRGSRKAPAGGADPLERELFKDALVVGLGCLVYLLSAPLAWLHYYLLAAPAAICMLRPIGDCQARRRPRGVAVNRCLGIASIVLLSVVALMQLVAGVKPAANLAALATIGGASVLFVLTLRELQSGG
jgi:hypothetical protein